MFFFVSSLRVKIKNTKGLRTPNSISFLSYLWLIGLLFIFPPTAFCDFGLPTYELKESVSGNKSLISLNRCCPPGQGFQDDGHGKFSCVTVQLMGGSKPTATRNFQHFKFPSTPIPEEILSVQKEFVLFAENEDSNPFRFKLYSPHATSISFTCGPLSKGNFSVRVKIGNGKQNKSYNDNEFTAQILNYNTSPQTDVGLLTATGLLRIGREYFSRPEFCVAGLRTENEVSIFVCNATCRKETPCLQKCCDLNEIWDENQVSGQNCIPKGNFTWTPTFYSDYRTKLSRGVLRSLHPHFRISPPSDWCNKTAYQPTLLNQNDGRGRRFTKFRITRDGGVLRRLGRYFWKNTEDDRRFYCVDGGILKSNNDDSNSNQSSDDSVKVESILFRCGPDDFKMNTWQHVINGFLMALSCIFLVLTILVYLLLWADQNVHGYTILSYIISLFFVYFFFTLMYYAQFQLVGGISAKVSSFCQFIGMGNNFFFLSTFCWTFMINFDLWCTLRNLKPTVGRSKGIRRFLAYATFSLGLPTVVLSVGMGMDHAYGDDYDSSVIVPSYGRMRCLLEPDDSQLIYAYGPAGLILILNAIFFSFSVFTMYRIRKSTKLATSSSSANSGGKGTQRPNSQSFRLFSKLLFVMVLPWIFVVSWASGRRRLGFTPLYWIFFDSVNALQSFAIFYIFVCKPDIVRSLEKKYPSIKKVLSLIPTGSILNHRIPSKTSSTS